MSALRIRRLAALVALVVATGAAAVVLLGGDEPRYEARFGSARGLVEGNDVRVSGAVAGRVQGVRLARDGTALVTFSVDRDDLRPRADAAAAIRPVDLLGDTYLSLSPGTARRALRGAIGRDRTSNPPRLDEALSAFSPAVRDGLRILLVEGGLALERRGADLARAATAMRPALEATSGVLREVDAQNGALAAVVADAERVATPLAERSGDVGPLIGDAARTLRATAASSASLRAGLRKLPASIDRVTGTATRLGRTASAAQPVAARLRAGAADLGSTVSELPALLARVRTTAAAARPLLRAGRSLLVRGDGALGELTSAVAAVRTGTPEVASLLDTLAPAMPGIAQGFLVEFPDQAREPGRQPLDPFADPRRGYWRGAAVLSCEAFGVPIAPGCLTKAFSFGSPAKKQQQRPAKASAPTPATPAPTPTTPAPVPAPAPQQPADPIRQTVDEVEKITPQPVDDLLDFLLG